MPLKFDSLEVIVKNPQPSDEPLEYPSVGVQVKLRGRRFGQFTHIDVAGDDAKRDDVAASMTSIVEGDILSAIRWARQDFGEENETVIEGEDNAVEKG